MQNLSSLASTLTDLDRNFDLFSRKIQDCLEIFLDFSKSEKSSEQRFPKGIFYQILSHLAFFESFQN
jgi:hypothetical protein